MKFKLIAFTLLALAACQKPKNDRNPAVLGNWKGMEWLVDGKPANGDAAQVEFEFMTNDYFRMKLGPQSKIGTWRTDKDVLYIQEQGKEELAVKFVRSQIPHKYDISDAITAGHITEALSWLRRMTPDEAAKIEAVYDVQKISEMESRPQRGDKERFAAFVSIMLTGSKLNFGAVMLDLEMNRNGQQETFKLLQR